MRTSTKVFLIINLISLVGTAVLFPSLITILSYEPAFTITFTIQSIVALSLAAIWFFTGAILFSRFIKKQAFPRKLFFVTITYTGVFALIVISLLNISSFNYAPIVMFRNTAGITPGGGNMTIIYVMVGIVSAIFIFALALTYRRLSKPIKKINHIISQMNSDIHKAGGYKLGQCKEFAQIAQGLTELDNKFVEQTKLLKVASDEYEKIVPKQMLKHLGVKNFSGLIIGDNVSKEVTTMFCDLKNSTEKSEAMTATENFKFINDYLGIISPIVRKHNGFVDKYLGDGILAVFPLPDNAIKCSKEIVAEIQIKNKQMLLPYQMEVKIGIHTGEVVFGVVGDEKRKSPTIISDTVNYTAKMQEVNEIYNTTIILSKATLSKISIPFSTRYIGGLNFESGMRLAIYELLDVLPLERMKTIQNNKLTFEQAIHLVEEGKMSEAKPILLKLKKIDPKDGVVNVYLQKCLADKNIK